MTWLRVAAVALILGGVGAIAWAKYVPAAQDAATYRAQSQLGHEVPTPIRVLPGARLGPPIAAPAATGHALATLRVPAFGADWRWTAVEGVGDAQLATGPGHYPGTPLPGEYGNVAFAAHRAGHGDPFLDFDQLRPGERVEFTQGDVTWVYRLDTFPRIIEASDVSVLDPLPGHRLTLTTCWPKWGSSKRMVVVGHLARVAS